MALSAHERQAMLLTLDVEVPEGASEWTSAAFFQVIQRVFNARSGDMEVSEGLAAEAIEEDEEGEEVASPVLHAPAATGTEAVAAMTIPSGRVVSSDGLMRIADMRTGEDGTVTILLHHADRKASDPALMHLPTGALRTAGKGDDDGLAHGAHLVIKTMPEARSKPTQARAVLERAPNLGRGSVVTFLNMLVRRVAQSNQMGYIKPEDGKYHRYNPKLAAKQPLSASFKKDIEGNKITSIELHALKPETGLDEDGVSAKSRTLVLTVDPAYPRENRLGLLDRIRKKAVAEGYQDMQVRLKSPRSSPAMSPRFAMDVSDAADVVYARMEPLAGFSGKLDQCPDAIVSEILNKMHAMFAKRSLWE